MTTQMKVWQFRVLDWIHIFKYISISINFNKCPDNVARARLFLLFDYEFWADQFSLLLKILTSNKYFQQSLAYISFVNAPNNNNKDLLQYPGLLTFRIMP